MFKKHIVLIILYISVFAASYTYAENRIKCLDLETSKGRVACAVTLRDQLKLVYDSIHAIDYDKYQFLIDQENEVNAIEDFKTKVERITHLVNSIDYLHAGLKRMVRDQVGVLDLIIENDSNVYFWSCYAIEFLDHGKIFLFDSRIYEILYDDNRIVHNDITNTMRLDDAPWMVYKITARQIFDEIVIPYVLKNQSVNPVIKNSYDI